MLIVCNARLARRIAAVATAASTDDGRPVLTSVLVEWDAEPSVGMPSVTFTATDSYRLITYQVTETGPGRPRFGETDGAGATLVRGKQFKSMLERAANHATIKDGHVVLDLTDGLPIVVGATHPDKGTMEDKIGTLDGYDHTSFPKFRSLIPTIDPRAGADATVHAVNPRYLAELIAASQAGRVDELEEVPIKLSVPTERSSLTPILITTNAGEDGWTGLLMQVRL